MITGDNEREIKAYVMIDRLEEGLSWQEPSEDDRIFGIPYGWHGENSKPFIEHRKNGFVTKTVNVSDVSEIEFWMHIEPYGPVTENEHC